ncbi:hypothetical protein POUND7_008588 [Theobroma cacao]
MRELRFPPPIAIHLILITLAYSLSLTYRNGKQDKISFEKVSSSTPQSVYSNTLLTEEMEHNEVIDGIRTPQQLLFRAIIHEHAMRFCEVVEKSKKNHYCEACRLVLSGPCYICTTCLDANEEYCLHEKCARLPYEIQHPFHSSHRLNLYTTYSDEIGLIICDECRDVCFGFFYRCDECDFKLDVKCATLTVHKTEVLQLKKMERVVQLNPFYHPHKLVFGNFSDPTPKKACKFCSLPMLGPAYFCPNYYCHFQVHESCLRTPQKIRVPFHLENMLLGKINNDSQCYACGKDTYPFRYSCKQPYLKLHPQCVSSLRRPLICESHKHYLYYFGTKFQQLRKRFKDRIFPCSECWKNCRGPFYRCLECAINFHLECVPISHIFKSTCHIHCLTIKDSFVEDDSEESYCDICEQERCPDDHVYCCEECNNLFAAHIECVFAKVENNTAAVYAFSYLELEFEKHSVKNNSGWMDEQDYNCSVEFFQSPLLVQEWQSLERNGSSRETLRLDKMDKSSYKYKNADDKISFEKVSSSTPQSIYSNTLLTEEMEHNEVIDGIRTPQQLSSVPSFNHRPNFFIPRSNSPVIRAQLVGS